MILVATLVIFLIILSFITQSLILQSFTVLEEKDTTANVQKFIAQSTTKWRMSQPPVRTGLSGMRRPRSFQDTQDAKDQSVPFQPISMKNLGIDYILIYNSSGSLIFSEAIAPDGSAENPVPGELDGIVHDSIIPEGSPEGIAGRRGISYINNNPIILAGYPSPPATEQDLPGHSRHGKGTDTGPDQ